MAFLKEGAVKDLMMRGPELEDLLDWSAENVLHGTENPSQKIVDYARDHEMTVSEFEAFVNIQLTSLGEDQSDEALDTKDVLQDLLFNIEEGREHNEINEYNEFNRDLTPHQKIGIGKDQEYFWGKYPYRDMKYVTFLETQPEDTDGDHKYRAVMYKGGDWDQTEKKWTLGIEKYIPENKTPDGIKKGWDRTPGSWFLETLLHEDEYSAGRPPNDVLSIQGKEWLVKNMLAVYEEAKKIRDEHRVQESFYPRLDEYGQGRYSLKKALENKLQPIADDLGAELIKGEKKDQKNVHGTRSVTQFYTIGDVPIMVRDTKVPGMGSDDVEIWVLDKEDSGKGVAFHGMSGYSGLLDFISKELGATGGIPQEAKPESYTQKKLDALLKDLKGATGDIGPVGDDEAFDLADGILADEPGLEDFIRKELGIEDPLGWLANKID